MRIKIIILFLSFFTYHSCSRPQKSIRIFEKSHILTPIKNKGVWGYIKEDGTIKISFHFEEANHFKEGFASVKLNGKWGIIDIRHLHRITN